MPAVSQAQQKLMGMAYAYKKGDMKEEDASKEVKELADSMSLEDLKDYAETKHDDLPAKKESKDNPDEEELENDDKKPLESKEPKKMKHLKTFEDFVRECEGDKDDDGESEDKLEESRKSFQDLSHELVEIAADYTNVDLTPSMSQAQSIDDKDKFEVFYDEMIDFLIEEDVTPAKIKDYQRDINALLKKNGIPGY